MRIRHDQNLTKHWTELKAQGVPLEEPEYRWRAGSLDYEEELFIEQRGGIAENCIIEADKYYVYYILNARVINRLPAAELILEKTLVLRWDDAQFEWLSDPAAEHHSSVVYAFPGKSGDEYPRSAVLNHQIEKPLQRGAMCEGLLLGFGWAPIPKTIRHGAVIDVTLTLIDQYSRHYSKEFAIWVCRSERSRKAVRQRCDRIFADRDRTSKRASSVRELTRPGKATAEPREEIALHEER